ncbi:MAG: preprotein translocase subunit SecE [Candidatus Electryonea clarkiae]|nr:preprotein translocase subunit SecE [Candidatus Electryonea clarkiae]MDP8288934.1 preprotein translocase subunit SecE [Candidatus Electryonea clarkiae]
MLRKSIAYVRSVRTEMGKVSWPTRETLFESTGITLMLALIMAIFIFAADQIISRIINFII